MGDVVVVFEVVSLDVVDSFEVAIAIEEFRFISFHNILVDAVKECYELETPQTFRNFKQKSSTRVPILLHTGILKDEKVVNDKYRLINNQLYVS